MILSLEDIMEFGYHSLHGVLRLLSITILITVAMGTTHDRSSASLSQAGFASDVIPVATTFANYDDNSFTHILKAIFPSTLTSLDKIDFQRNPVTGIDAFAFSDLPNLTWLAFRACNLPIITRNMFAGITKLDYLKIYSCQVQTIEPNSFEDLGLLTDLQLGENYDLHHIHAGTQNNSKFSGDSLVWDVQ